MRPSLAAASVGLLLVLAGGLFDAEPLFVGGVAFVVLAAAATAWVALAARGARVERAVSAHRVVEDEPLQVRVGLTGPLPLPGGEVDEPLLSAPAPVRAGRREARIRIEVRFVRRGLRRIEPPRVVLRDPLGLAERTLVPRETAPIDVLVLPRTEPVQVRAEPDPSGAGRALTALAGAAEVELDGLRAYRPGSPAARIHWPPLARGAGLLERRLLPDGDGRPIVVLDPRAPQRPEDLDAAVRAVASLVVALARAAGCALLLPGERRATRIERDLGLWPAAWARLALVEEGPPPPLAGLATRTGPVFYVAACEPIRLPRALDHAPGLRVLVVPGELRGRAEILAVAGCHGYALGRVGARRPAARGVRGHLVGGMRGGDLR
jgi:uncharacterized protein (DUF58 family)